MPRRKVETKQAAERRRRIERKRRMHGDVFEKHVRRKVASKTGGKVDVKKAVEEGRSIAKYKTKSRKHGKQSKIKSGKNSSYTME